MIDVQGDGKNKKDPKEINAAINESLMLALDQNSPEFVELYLRLGAQPWQVLRSSTPSAHA